MLHRNNDAPSRCVVSDERMRNELRKRIHRAMHIDKSHTRETLASDSGVKLHHIDAIISTDSAKHRRVAAEDAFSIAYALGDGAVNALLGLIGYGSAQTLDRPTASRPMMIVAGAMRELAIIGEAAADDIIDHTEKEPVADAADQLIALVTPLSSAGRLQ